MWAYLLAYSADEIADLSLTPRVYDDPPTCMPTDDLEMLSSSMTIDISNREHPFLAVLSKK